MHWNAKLPGEGNTIKPSLSHLPIKVMDPAILLLSCVHAGISTRVPHRPKGWLSIRGWVEKVVGVGLNCSPSRLHGVCCTEVIIVILVGLLRPTDRNTRLSSFLLLRAFLRIE